MKRKEDDMIICDVCQSHPAGPVRLRTVGVHCLDREILNSGRISGMPMFQPNELPEPDLCVPCVNKLRAAIKLVVGEFVSAGAK